MPTNPEKPADPTLNPLKAEALYKAWTSHIADALKREKNYRISAQKCVDLYEAKKPDETPFAILYSNTEVLAPAVYNARPIPIVQRRYKDADPVGKAVCDVSIRMLKYLIDNETDSYDGFDDLIQAAVLDSLVTNRGLTRFKFGASQGAMAECVYGEAVRWDKFFHGYARTWKKVPWIGFEWDMSEDEVRKNFPDLPVDFKNLPDASEDENNKAESRDELQGVRLVKVYEIWDKRTRMVYFFSPCYTKGPLRAVQDPLELKGFFPVPKPINFTRKITTLIPTPLYEFYRSQAQELNDITNRLKAIIKAIKFRGAYNSAVEGIEKMLQAEDNELVPVENVQSMPDGTAMDKLFWTVPTNDLASTAQSLYQQREQVKNVIYEITGISDILRGASVASETATAQQIKNQWGSLRLKKMQKEVQRYVRECLSIMLEIGGGKFELQTIMAMTGAPYLTTEQKAQIQQQMAMAQAAMQQPPIPGQPPAQPPQLPPEIQLAIKEPAWEEIHQLLRSDLLLGYKTDIETNSTIDAEAAQDKQDISELLNALSQFLNGLAPLVQQGMMPFDVAKNMLLVIARRYNFGSQLEDSLMSMVEPPQQAGDPADEAKAKIAETNAMVAQEKAKLDMQKMQQEAQLSAQEHQQKMELMAAELELAREELAIKKQELELQAKAVGMKLQAQTIAHNQKMAQLTAPKPEPAQQEKSNAINS